MIFGLVLRSILQCVNSVVIAACFTVEVDIWYYWWCFLLCVVDLYFVFVWLWAMIVWFVCLLSGGLVLVVIVLFDYLGWRYCGLCWLRSGLVVWGVRLRELLCGVGIGGLIGVGWLLVSLIYFCDFGFVRVGVLRIVLLVVFNSVVIMIVVWAWFASCRCVDCLFVICVWISVVCMLFVRVICCF